MNRRMTSSAVVSEDVSVYEAPFSSTPLRYLYILGAGHSGSTLLAMLLGTHPQVCTIGELKAAATDPTGDYRCSCGQRLAECEFWRALFHELRARAGLVLSADETDIRSAPTAYLRLLLKPLHRAGSMETLRDAALGLSPSWKRHVRRVQTLNAALARAACATSGKQVFVDSSKTGLQLKYLRDSPDLDVRVVRLVRDGRGVALSYRRADGLSLADAAYRWRRSNEEAESVVSRLPRGQWLDLRYEQLCAEPAAALRAVHRLIGVDPDLAPSPATQHVLGNDRVRTQAMHIRLDDRWRRTLTPDELIAFDGVAGPMNRRFGYPA